MPIRNPGYACKTLGFTQNYYKKEEKACQQSWSEATQQSSSLVIMI
jgi:hypothetical protein